jgi:hypothetical protein
MRTCWFLAPVTAVAVFSFVTCAVAQDNELPHYGPLLPQAKARAWPM